MPKSLVPRVEQLLGIESADIVEMFLQNVTQRGRGLLGIIVRTTVRLRDHLVDDPEILKMVCAHFQSFGGGGRGRAILPKDGRTALGRDDRVIAVLEDQDAVGHADSECSTRTTFSDHD